MLYIFMYHSERFGLYFDSHTPSPLEGSPSGSSFPSCTLILKNNIFIPIPDQNAGSFIPDPNSKLKFEIRFDIIRSETSG
jgi:molecular chaperone HtpG